MDLIRNDVPLSGHLCSLVTCANMGTIHMETHRMFSVRLPYLKSMRSIGQKKHVKSLFLEIKAKQICFGKEQTLAASGGKLLLQALERTRW